MKKVNVHEAKTHLSRLLEEVEGGAEIVIARAGKPVAKLVRLPPPRKKRIFGQDRGKIDMSRFDEGDAEIRKDWEAALKRRGIW